MSKIKEELQVKEAIKEAAAKRRGMYASYVSILAITPLR